VRAELAPGQGNGSVSLFVHFAVRSVEPDIADIRRNEDRSHNYIAVNAKEIERWTSSARPFRTPASSWQR
jgi:hypothetical protein